MHPDTITRRRGSRRDASSGSRRVRALASGFVLGVSALGVLGAGAAAAGTDVPYGDPAQSGYIGLCNAKGQQITSGSVDAAPFAWRAVSSVAAPAAYTGASRTAVLLAFQPIDGLAPSDWSGDQLTASSRYSNPADPMAAATTRDESLEQFMLEFSPKWDGLLQLRMYLGAANEQGYATHYPALDIQVTGHTWRALDGGPVDCAAGTAESIESILLPASTQSSSGDRSTQSSSAAAGSPKPTTGASSAPSSPSGATPAGGSPASPGSNGSATAAAKGHSHQSVTAASSSDSWLPAAVGVALAAALVVPFLLLLRRRRRRGGTPTESTPATSSPSSASEETVQPVAAGSASSSAP